MGHALRQRQTVCSISHTRNISPGGEQLFVVNKVGRDNMPPPMAVLGPMVAKIAADLRPSADGSAVRTFLVAGGD